MYDKEAALRGFHAFLDVIEVRFDEAVVTRHTRKDSTLINYVFGGKEILLGIGPNLTSFLPPELHDKLSLAIVPDEEQVRLFTVLEGDRKNVEHDHARLCLHDFYVTALHELDVRGYRFAILHPVKRNVPPTIVATHTSAQPPLVLLWSQVRKPPVKEVFDVDPTHT